MNERPTSLAAIETEVWHQLGLAVQDKAHGWRTPVLATIAGDTADARTVILREVDEKDRQHVVYTDERAGKVSQVHEHPRGTLVMWSPQLGWQLRCRVRLDIEMSGLAVTSRWARVKLSPTAQDYLSPQPPGMRLADDEAPTHAAVERTHFAVIVAQVLSIDWLELHPQGHRRALFDGDNTHWRQP